MKIKSMQSGGIIYTPFIPNNEEIPQQNIPSNDSKKEKITGTITKEIIDLIKENGLINDVDVTLNEVANFLNQSSMLSNFTAFGGSDPDFSLAQLMQVQSLVNRTKRNKETYDEASKVLSKENAWSDVAIDTRGYIYALNGENGALEKIKATQYAENRDKYQALDYGSLMSLREKDPNLAYNVSILTDAGSAIGLQSISDYLVDIVKDFGKESETGYIKKLPQNVQDGLQALIANGPDGIYKATSETEIKDINAAIAYLDASLNPRMKATIDAHNAGEGRDASKNGRLKFIYDVITHHTDNKISVDFEKTASDAASGKGGGSEKTVQESLAHAYATGNGLGETQTIQITPYNTGATIFAQAHILGPIVDDNNQPIGTTSLQQAFQKSGSLRAVIDAQSVTFGDQLLNPNTYEKIMYDGNTQMYRAWLPSKNVNGRITVDFDTQQQADKLMDQIKNSGITDDRMIKDLVEQQFPDATWDLIEKVIKFNSSRPFVVIGAYASGKEFSGLSDSKYIWNLPRDEGREIKNKYNNLMKYSDIYGGKTETNIGGKTRNAGNFYQGNIYIPITDGMAGARIYDRQYAPQNQFTELNAKADMNNYLNLVQQQNFGQQTNIRSNF